MHDRKFKKTSLLSLGTLAVAVCLSYPAATAGQETGKAAEPDSLVLVYPTGDRATSSLLVEAVAPAEVPVGKSYNYLIRVTNLTRNLILQDVEINQATPDGFSIEESRVLGRDESASSDGQGQKDASRAKDDQGKEKSDKDGADQKDNADRKGGKDTQDADGHKGGHDAQASEGRGSEPHWMIDRLGPGESRAIAVTAVGDTEGMAASCIQVSYKPTLCVVTRFVKPEVQLTKSAPDRIDICEPIVFHYTLKNTGTGVARDLTIRDELPDGLKTADGKSVVEIKAGDVAAGSTVDREVRVVASESGEFASRATAQGANDLSARSGRPSTKVVQAKLRADIEGPSVQYVGRPITYQVHVKNNGDARANRARLQVDVDRGARVLRLSKAQPGDLEPTSANGPTLTWDLGDIEPGKDRAVSFTVVGNAKADFEHSVRATSVCAASGDIAETATATRTVATSILTFPALVLEMVDQNDPVPVGKNEVYTIAVRNQGSGPDEDVKVVVTLPDELTFVSAEGPTKANADGRKVMFESIDRLAPRERAVWKLTAKAEKSADARTRAELSSNYLSAENPGVSVEPTRLID